MSLNNVPWSRDLVDVVEVVEAATKNAPGLKSSPCKGPPAGPCLAC